MNALDDYFSTLARDAHAATGRALDGGTVIAPNERRAGSGAATSYPTPSGTIIWCDPAIVDTVADILEGVAGRAIDSSEFVDLATERGATLSGFGNNRVLLGAVGRPVISASNVTARRLDGDDPIDLELLATLASGVSEDDRDEAEFDLDRLDPFIVGVLLDGQLIADASGIAASIDERFDDIAVLTHPDHRRRGFAAFAVSEFVRHRLADDPARRFLYRCNSDNSGSNAVAESLGFTLANTLGAVRFPLGGN